ncbi:uncharacterized protein H6S33_004960, partial [Morchella sextelata]|uniref:uncharacterized protein n=1 Tax=Morchella sextelata TaxID=1174677 RepID=UPI001D048A3C
MKPWISPLENSKIEYYDTRENQEQAKPAILRSRIKGKAADWILRRSKTTTSSWDEVVKALKNKYDNADRNDESRRSSENQLLKMKEGKLTLKQYFRKATLNETAPKSFILGIKDENTRKKKKKKNRNRRKNEEVGNTSNGESDIETEDSSSSESSSSKSSSSSNSESGESERRRKNKKKQQKKKTRIKKMSFNQDGLQAILAPETEVFAGQRGRRGPPNGPQHNQGSYNHTHLSYIQGRQSFGLGYSSPEHFAQAPYGSDPTQYPEQRNYQNQYQYPGERHQYPNERQWSNESRRPSGFQGEQRPPGNLQKVPSLPIAHGVEYWRQSMDKMHTSEASLIEWIDAHNIEKRVGKEAFGSKWNIVASRKKVTVREETEEAEGSGRGVDTSENQAKQVSTKANELKEESNYNPPEKKAKTQTRTTVKVALDIKKPIKMMKGQLFELAPAARRDVAKGLVQERASKPAKLKADKSKDIEMKDAEEITGVDLIGCKRASADDRPVLNICTYGKVRLPNNGGYYELKKCQVQGDYETDTYIIKDREGNDYSVPAMKGKNVKSQQVSLRRELAIVNLNEIDLDEEIIEEHESGQDLMSAIIYQIVKQTEEQDIEGSEDDQVYGINTTGYPTDERPADYHREMDKSANDTMIQEWHESCKTTIRPAAATEEEWKHAMRLLYTCRDR